MKRKEQLQKMLTQAQERRTSAQDLLEKANKAIDDAIGLVSGDEVSKDDLAKAATMEETAEAQKAMAQKQLTTIGADVKAIEDELAELEKAALPGSTPSGSGEGPFMGQDNSPAPGNGHQDSGDMAKSVTILRYSAPSDMKSMPINELAGFKAMQELYGGDYRQVNHDQNVAFSRLLRLNSRHVPGDVEKALSKMYFPIREVADMFNKGMEVERIKATMIEGADILGGYAVPPQRANEILRRTMGLTPMRQAGAIVVQTSSKLIEWLKVAGGNDQYPSDMRGKYGHETKNPDADNFEFDLIKIPVHIYTYKVPMSVSLLEDADNVETLFTELAAETLAIDENRDFLVGDGANKPEGILPGQANVHSLAEVVTGDADDLTYDGLKKLRRGVASQYRMAGGTAFIGNNQSGEDIELMKDGESRYHVEALEPGGGFLGGRWWESEALPDPAAGTFPVVYGKFNGYAIVERLGLTIQRYNDSNTGVNVVEFHIRRRIGGAVVQPYKFAVQKVAAS